MATKELQTTISRLRGFGVTITSLFLITSGVSDPVNVTKLLIAGGVGTSGLALFIAFGLRQAFSKYRLTVVACLLFVLAGLNAVVFSKAPTFQNLYGTYGRNTGYLAYIFMVGVLLCALMMNSEVAFKYLISGLIATGIVNVIYCGWVLAFGDFIGWSNPYGNILGLFGNPDFISAFLGMFITTSVALAFSSKLKLWQRAALLLSSLIAFYEVLKSHAIQGVVVTAGGLAVIGFYFVYSKFSGRIMPTLYLILTFAVGALAILGALQKGPMKFVYKRSVSLRGSYWHAGIDMGNKNPFHGIGFDTYGDWYRRSRPPVALVDMPGVNIMSNVSHNVVIDFFASGGWPLLLSYLALLFLGFRSIVRITKRNRTFDPIFVAMAATWLCYETQSLISINQIGLTIWGWALTGALISYDGFVVKNDVAAPSISKRARNGKIGTTSLISPALVASIGAGLGLFLAAPAISSDTTWQTANQSRNLENIKHALVPTIMNPANSFKYAQAVDLLQRSNLLDLAHQYALEATNFNPDYFDAWKQLFFLPNVSTSEKQLALSNMKRLDPLNPDVTQIR